MWDKVVDQNIDSYAASVKWAKLDKKGNEAHDFHSLYWLLYGYLQQGKLNDAKSVLSTMKKIADEDPSDRVQGYYGMMKARYAIESDQWEELFIPKTPTETQERLNANLHAGCVGSESEHNRISSILGLGIGATRTGNLKVAESALEHIRHLKSTYSNDNGGFDQKVLDIQYSSIAGLVEMAKGSKTKGIQLLKKAAQAEERLDPPSGPPIPAKPATELYAEALLNQNETQEALKWFKRSLVRTPGRTLSLLGALKASRKLKRDLESKEYMEILKRNLSQADSSVKIMMF
jgi:tetratricopeptide (TPR) repeat protein